MVDALTKEDRMFLIDVLSDTHDLTLATLRPDGFPQATVVSFVHDGPVIYFGCGVDSQKAHNIDQDARVSITVTPPYDDWMKIRGLSMGAKAIKVTENREFERVGNLMTERFPQSEDLMDQFKDIEMAVYRIEPEVISFLDYGQGFGHTALKEAKGLTAAA